MEMRTASAGIEIVDIHKSDTFLSLVHLVGRRNEKVFEERNVEFELGSGVDFDVPNGVEIALAKFKKGERSKIILSSKYADGEPAEYDVTLISFQAVRLFLLSFDVFHDCFTIS